MSKKTSRLLAFMLCVMMLVSILPMAALADYNPNYESANYSVFKHTESTLAPGITQYANYAFDANGKQVKYHVAMADLSNEDVIVQTSYKNQFTAGFGMAKLSQQMAYANSLYTDPTSDRFISENYSAVAGINASFYNMTTGQPSGRTVLDGISIGEGSYGGFFALLDDGTAVIMKDAGTDNWNSVKDHVVQAIGGESVFLLNGEKQMPYTSYCSQAYPHSMIGITADNKVVIAQTDGSASEGFGGDALADVMLEAGCVSALSLDGGGSATYCAKPEGEDEVKVLGGCSDGSERTISAGVIFASKAAPSNSFDHVNITVENAYITTGVSTTFTVAGVSYSGNSAEIPENITYEATKGTVENGVFTATELGDAVISAKVGDKTVGTATIHVCAPEKIAFATSKYSVKFGTVADLVVIATINNGKNEIAMSADSFDIVLSNTEIGTLDGLAFTAVTEENAPANKTGTVTVTYKDNRSLSCSTDVAIMREVTEVIDSFDGSSNKWHAEEINGEGENAWYGKNYTLTDATVEDGQVHDGDGSMRISINNLNAKINYNANSKDYFQLLVMPEKSIEIKDCESYGLWMYIPDDMYSLYVDLWYYTDNNNDGTYETVNKINKIVAANAILNQAEDSHWYYLKVDVGGKNILLPGQDLSDWFGKAAVLKDERCIQIVLMPFNGQAALQRIGSINGIYNMYVDSLTADYAKDVADRVAPVFGNVSLLKNNGSTVDLARSVVTIDSASKVIADTTDSTLSVVANVSDAGDGINPSTAKAYVDGIEVNCTYVDGKIAISDIAVANGVHRVSFKVADRAGNEATVVRLVKVNSDVDASTVVVEPKDKTLDKIYGGSVYWMDVKATDIETIQSVVTTIDINSVNHWELDHMVVADGFTANYTLNKESNTATITITRTGDNKETGEAVLASLPIRIVYYDTDIQYPGLTAAEYWQSAKWTVWFWPQDLKVDVDMGKITYVEDYDANTIGAFSNECFSVCTEMYVSQQQMSVSDPTYYKEHKTCHVHAPHAIADVSATCTTDGFTGRTYCDVCQSVVDWGTTVPATGHTYALVDGVMKCSCGETFTGEMDGIDYVDGIAQNGWVGDSYYIDGTKLTGIQQIDGIYYDFGENGVCEGKMKYTGLLYDDTVDAWRYIKLGVISNGWVEIDEEWYYFRSTTNCAAVGKYKVGSVEYVFDTNGRVTDGVWVTTSDGTRYYYGPGFYKASNASNGSWKTIDGQLYCFNTKGYRYVGINKIVESNSKDVLIYEFGDDGVCIGQVNDETCNGVVYTKNAGGYYFVNGEVPEAGLVKWNDDYYYVRSDGSLMVGNIYISAAKANGLVNAGSYEFDADGKMINAPEIKSGIIDGFYYENGVIAKDVGLIQWKDDYYYIRSNGSVMVGSIYINSTKANGLVKSGTYKFDEEGKMIVAAAKNGIVDGFYYENDEIVKDVGLIQWKDDYYYIRSNGSVMVGSIYINSTKANGLVKSGTYKFDEEGKMIVPEMKNGIVDGFYYENDEVVLNAGLVEWNNNLYYIRSNGSVMVGRIYISTAKANGLVKSGTYTFGEDGTMVTN